MSVQFLEQVETAEAAVDFDLVMHVLDKLSSEEARKLREACPETVFCATTTAYNEASKTHEHSGDVLLVAGEAYTAPTPVAAM